MNCHGGAMGLLLNAENCTFASIINRDIKIHEAEHGLSGKISKQAHCPQ